MRENEWTDSIKELLQAADFDENIYFDTLNKIPYAQEILSYDLSFKKNKENTMLFETDLLVYEKDKWLIIFFQAYSPTFT